MTPQSSLEYIAKIEGFYMRLVDSKAVLFKEASPGEHFSILAGRHNQHGQTKNHTVALVELMPGHASAPHFHREREESYFFLEGSGVAKIDGTEVEIGQGKMLTTTPGEKHEFLNNSESPLKYLVITAPAWTPEDSHH